MKIAFALLIMSFLAFSGYHLTFRHFRLPLFARQFYLTGIEFLFLGLLLGPRFANLLDIETQKGLAPLSAFLLGWIGLLFGFQFDIKKLRRIPVDYLIAAISEGLLTLTLVFFAVYYLLPLFLDIPNPMKIVLSLTLAAAAACTSQSGLALMTPNFKQDGRDTLMLLRHISNFDAFGSLLVFALAFFFHPASLSDLSWLKGLERGTAVSLGASLGLLILFILFLSQRRRRSELILVAIGMTVLMSGMASVLRFSPLVINFFVGIWLVNLSSEKERIYQILVNLEKPIYLLLLVFLGANLHLGSLWVAFYAMLYCLTRFAGKFFAGYLMTSITRGLKGYPRNLGLGLLAQGGLPFAILVDFQQGFPCRLSTFIISLAVIGIIYNEFLSPLFLNRLLKKAQ